MINLQRRGDKRERALCNLDFLMPAQIFAAVDGAALERRNGIKRTIGDVCHLYWDGKHKREHHIVKGVHNAETAWATLGCMLSHQQVLSLPFGDKSFRMILEDDILHPCAQQASRQQSDLSFPVALVLVLALVLFFSSSWGGACVQDEATHNKCSCQG